MNSLAWKNASPEQYFNWKKAISVASALGNVAITSLYYAGNITGSEFITYSVNKIYVPLIMEFSYHLDLTIAPYVIIRNEFDIEVIRYANSSSYFNSNTNVPMYTPITLKIKNIFFGRILFFGYDKMIFRGYRIDITP